VRLHAATIAAAAGVEKEEALVGGVVVWLARHAPLSCRNLRQWITLGVDIHSVIHSLIHSLMHSVNLSLHPSIYPFIHSFFHHSFKEKEARQQLSHGALQHASIAASQQSQINTALCT
jgi:hypothetical protein